MELVKKDFDPIKGDWLKQSGTTEVEFNREVSFACQHIYKTPFLQKCSKESVWKAVINLAQVGLSLNPISKYAALVPRWNEPSKSYECVLEPMYQGLIKLLTDSGAVTSIEAQVVFEGDDFMFDRATEEKITKHVPYFLTGQARGKIRAVYSKAVLKDKSFHVEIMSMADVEEVRERSESYKAMKAGKIKTCIWASDEAEMCRKTVIKRHQKYLPKSAGMERFHQAIELENQVNGRREEIGFGLLSFIESMIQNGTMNDDEKGRYIKELSALKYEHEGHALMKRLEQYVPIVGLERLPTDVGDAMEATRNRVDREDFKERKK
jgi:recombination protein RecT